MSSSASSSLSSSVSSSLSSLSSLSDIHSSLSTRETNVEKELEWLRNLQRYIFDNLLPLTNTTGEDRVKLVDSDVMVTWAMSFTHISYDRNPTNNYEVLERFGDRAMGLAFTDYITKKFPGVNVAQVNNLDVIYMSKPTQGMLARQYGLTEWVRTNVDVNIGVAEDLLEAFFGALFVIGDKKLGPGTGYVLCFNLLANILKPINIQLSEATIHPKTKLIEIFNKMKWGTLADVTQEIKANYEHGYRIIIRLPETAKKELLQFLPDMPNILASVEGPLLKPLRDVAYQKAIDTLSGKGITWEWADRITEIRGTRGGELSPYYANAMGKAQREGFKRIFFPKTKNTDEYAYVQLVGEKANGELVNLSFAEGPKIGQRNLEERLKIAAYTTYANS